MVKMTGIPRIYIIYYKFPQEYDCSGTQKMGISIFLEICTFVELFIFLDKFQDWKFPN